MTQVAEGGLVRLIETEARLAEAIAAAEREAAALLEAAKTAAAAGEAGSRARLEGDVAALVQRVAAERDAEVVRVVAEADARCRQLRELPAEAIGELAAWVETRLLAYPGEGESA
jgi:hypothetical protein